MIASLRRLASTPAAAGAGGGKGRQPLALVAAAAVGAGAAVFVGLRYTRDGAAPLQPSRGLSVTTWNVLARPYTMYNSKFHRAGAERSVENEEQTRRRYALAGEQIAERSDDLVFLQECEPAFFDPQWNTAAAKLLKQYKVFPCTRGMEPGTAVLVKEAGRAAPAGETICVGGSDETGGASKFAAILPVRVGAKELTAVSVHFSFDGMAHKRQRHVELIGQELEQADQLKGRSVVLGGDFNCAPGPRLAELEARSFLGGLRQAKLPEKSMTGLSGDFSEQVCIDHVYASQDLGGPTATALAQPASPWGGGVTPGEVTMASDHVPVAVNLRFA